MHKGLGYQPQRGERFGHYCNWCWRIGHKEAQCWFKQESVKHQEQASKIPNSVTFENVHMEKSNDPVKKKRKEKGKGKRRAKHQQIKKMSTQMRNTGHMKDVL